MKVWLVSFFVLFALLQSLHSIEQAFIPLPMIAMGGILLSVLSNLDALRNVN